MSRLEEPTNEASAMQKEISAIAEQGGGRATKVEQLIQQYCPDGVEFKKIKEVYQRIKGTPITAGKMKEIQCPDGEIRIFAGGKTVIDANEADIPNANITRVPAVLVQSRGIIDAIYYDKPFTFKNEMWAYTHKEQTSVKFLYYVMKQNIQHFRDAASGMGALPQISLGTTEDFSIPVPPLPVQEEIVRILDTLTELQAELQAELQKRKQQYNYYLDNLLSFNDINRGGQAEVKWMKMNEVFEIRNGYTPSKAKKEFWEGGTIPWFRMEDIRQNGRILSDSILHITPKGVKGKGLFKANSFILATTATIGEHALIIADSLANQRFTNLSIRKSLENELSVKYVYYYFFVIDEWCKANTNVSNFASVDMSKFYNLLIPIPSIAEQQRIVSILDRFDTITTDLTQGLPAEIEKRRQQYEYYRDKLLTFKRKGA